MVRGHLPKRIIVSFYCLLFVILFSSCKEEPQIKNQVIFRDGIIYDTASLSKFTGKVTDTISNKVLEYDVINGIKNGKFSIYYSNGKLEMSGSIKNNKNEGKWNYYYYNGTLESTGKFINDQPADKWTWYYPDGKVKEEGYFVKGQREGLWLLYDEDGIIKSKMHFKNGEKVNEKKVGNHFFS